MGKDLLTEQERKRIEEIPAELKECSKEIARLYERTNALRMEQRELNCKAYGYVRL